MVGRGRGEDATITIVVVDKEGAGRRQREKTNCRTIPVRGPNTPERSATSIRCATTDNFHQLPPFLSLASGCRRVDDIRTYQSRN